MKLLLHMTNTYIFETNLEITDISKSKNTEERLYEQHSISQLPTTSSVFIQICLPSSTKHALKKSEFIKSLKLLQT